MTTNPGAYDACISHKGFNSKDQSTCRCTHYCQQQQPPPPPIPGSSRSNQFLPPRGPNQALYGANNASYGNNAYDCNACGRDYPYPSYWVPRYDPYYIPNSAALHSGTPPHTHCGHGNQPCCNHGDQSAHRYSTSVRKSGNPDTIRTKGGKEVAFQEHVETDSADFNPEEVDPHLIASVEKSKLKARVVLLALLIILLIGGVAMGAVAAAMEPWWLHQKTDTTSRNTFASIEVGLWQTCYRSNLADAWTCHKYSSGGEHSSPYTNIQLLQWSMVVGSICALIALLTVVFALVVIRSKYFRHVLCVVIVFSLAAVVLFGLVIGFVNEDKKASLLVGGWVGERFSNDSELHTSTMFIIDCAATGVVGLAFILSCVLLYTYEPPVHVEPRREEIGLDVRHYPSNIKKTTPVEEGVVDIDWSKTEGGNRAHVNHVIESDDESSTGTEQNQDVPALHHHPLKSRDQYESVPDTTATTTVPPSRDAGGGRKVIGGPPSYFGRDPVINSTMINPNSASLPSSSQPQLKSFKRTDGPHNDVNIYFGERY